jgi:hypothetical protein
LLVLPASESAGDHGSDPRDHDADLGDQDPDPGDHDAPIRAITMRRSSRSRWRDTRSFGGRPFPSGHRGHGAIRGSTTLHCASVSAIEQRTMESASRRWNYFDQFALIGS